MTVTCSCAGGPGSGRPAVSDAAAELGYTSVEPSVTRASLDLPTVTRSQVHE